MIITSNNDIARAIYLVSKDKTNEELDIINNRIVKFLVRKRLFSKSKNILEQLNKIIDRENERFVVKIFSAQKLTERLKKELILFFKERYQVEEIVLMETLDEKLLGGMKVEVNDEIIDLTAKNKIKRLQEYLTRKV